MTGMLALHQIDDVRHVAVFAVAAVLVTARALTLTSGRRVWLTFAVGSVINTVAEAVSTFAYDGGIGGAAGALYAVAYLVTGVALARFLRRRVGDALRTFSLDALGIAVYLSAIASTVLVAPMMAHAGLSEVDATLNLLFAFADIAIAAVIFAVASFTGRRRGLQDQLLAAALTVMFAGDVATMLGRAGWLGDVQWWVRPLWECAMLLIAGAAWARPATAGSLRVGGWWELVPTLSWITGGGGVLVAAWAYDLPTASVVLAAGALALGTMRSVHLVREVRDLVVLRAESLVDELTGLANQRALFSELELLLREGGQDGRRVALLIGHLEGFDELTDTLGHEAADELLRQVAERLRGVGAATVARLGGDEFATIVEDGDPEAVAAAFEAALVAPVSMDGIAVSVRPVFGYARFPEDAGSPAGLARRADVARRDARARGLDVAAYEAARDHHSRDRLELAADLRGALSAGPGSADGLWLAFQPQVELTSGAVVGAEALIRWNHPVRGPISPAELLPVAERSGQMSALTDWVLDRALAELAALRAAGHPQLGVSINVSAVTLVDVGLAARIAAALARHGVPARALTIEVTEDAVMRDHRRCREVLGQIADVGVEISIDDFGTGQSSLGQLRHVPADEVKIDRRFVSGMAADPLDAEIVRLVVALGRRMGLRVVAEGVETERERLVLHRLGCDVVQGFGVGRPMAAADLARWLVRNQPQPATLLE